MVRDSARNQPKSILFENNETLKKLVLFIGQGFKDIAYLTNKEAWEAKNINPSNISAHVKAMWFIDYKERGFESFLHNLEMLKKIKINKMVSSAIYSNNKEKDMAVIGTFEKIKSVNAVSSGPCILGFTI